MDTNDEALSPYLAKVDHILVMGTTPGVGGNQVDSRLIKRYKKICLNNPMHKIGLDGGVDAGLVSQLDVKPDFIVSGTYIAEGVVKERVQTLRNIGSEIRG